MTTNVYLEKHEVRDMAQLYSRLDVPAESPRADEHLIRAHIAHCMKQLDAAERAVIERTRGRRYRVTTPWFDPVIIKVVDAFDPADGVEGWREE